jgi:hypothetical protein
VETLEEVYETSRQQFAFAIDPSQPVTRPLTAEEGAGWHRLWDSLLHMDRVFAGPLRGTLFYLWSPLDPVDADNIDIQMRRLSNDVAKT